MVQGFELFFSLFNNFALFIALFCIYGIFLTRIDIPSMLSRQAVLGSVFGLFALGCMYARIPVFDGVVVDQRNAVVVLSGAFGGPVAAVITGGLAGGFRIYLGGGGIWGGITGICLSAAAGIGLYRINGAFASFGRAVASSLAATLVILPGFLIMQDLHTGWTLLKAMALPYGSACFSSIFFTGLLLQRQGEKRLEELAFQESKERLDLALSGANEGLWDWDLETNTVHFDPRYYTLSGYEPDEFPGTFHEWERRLHPEDLPVVQSAVSRYIAGELDEYDVEFRFLHKNGDYMWIQGKGKIVGRDRSGKPIRFIGTHSDISARKEIERSLKLTQFSFDTAAVGIYLLDREARILDVNRHAATMLGFTTDQLKAKNLFDLDPDARREDSEPGWETLCREGTLHFERCHLHRDGRRIPVEVTSSLFEYEDQQFSLCFVKDISRRKEGERQIKQLQTYLSGIIESMPSLLIGVDSGCRATLWNKRAAAFRVPEIEGVSPSLDQLFPCLVPYLGEVGQSLSIQEIRRVSKCPFEWEPGLSGYADITIFPLTSEGIDGAVIRIDDVTEKIRMEETLVQNEKMLSVGGLAAGMAHEINNPLAGVLQNTMVLSNRLTDTTIPANIKTAGDLGVAMETIGEYMARRQIPEMVQAIREAGGRMASLVENMLNFARKSDASFSPQNPVDLMDKALALAATDYDLKKNYDFKSIAIEREYQDGLPPVECEPGGIQQVLLNILVNGSHAMARQAEQGGARFIVRLSHEAEPDMLRIEIEDNGPGMDRATAAKIFEPFFTTKLGSGGTGLGLSISYFIITENHKGTMAVVSEPGRGSCFIIRIPVHRP